LHESLAANSAFFPTLQPLSLGQTQPIQMTPPQPSVFPQQPMAGQLQTSEQQPNPLYRTPMATPPAETESSEQQPSISRSIDGAHEDESQMAPGSVPAPHVLNQHSHGNQRATEPTRYERES
jgi:hypothetical protein